VLFQSLVEINLGLLQLSPFYIYAQTAQECSLLTETEQGVAQAIIRSVIDFKRDPWPKVSDNAKDLVKKMLNPDPKQRLTAQENIHGYKMPRKHPMFHWVRL
ncbi:hypothetical protein Goshw_008996, partial [Gossypium schwendimanii]|nr:hypothetical protein [Gossypium schwendimanii]